MLNRTLSLCLLGLTLTLLLGGCAAQNDVDPIDLPGDRDNGTSTLTAKSDAWNATNDPQRIASNLNYVLADLPLEGSTENEAWAASYWPTYQGSTNYRWQGDSVLSPMEKYDAAFHDWTVSDEYSSSVPSDCGDDANEFFTAYRNTLGPAARWQAGAQGRDRMYDGENNDSDDDETIDECGGSDFDGIETWLCLCHAWAPAAILEPEPLRAVEYNGQRFEVADIKALLITLYDDTRAYGLGGRCNAEEMDHDDTGRVVSEECRDTNAGAWHVIVTNFLGINNEPFIEDRTGDYQVWNQPVVGYDIQTQNEITLSRALDLLDQAEGDSYPFNDQAEQFFEVEMTTRWVTESHQSTSPVGNDGYVRSDHYHYILEVDGRGKIIGGEWVGSSRDAHPDFLWVPTAAETSSWRRSNPHVDLEKARLLLEMSRREDPPPAGSGATYTNDQAIDIPDNNSTGVSRVIEVPESMDVTEVNVAVDVNHTWRGDLKVVLSHAGRSVVLHDKEGGSADDLKESWTLDDFAGLDAAGVWELTVSDHAGQDTGTLNSFEITILGGEPVEPPPASGLTESADVPLDIPDNDTTGTEASLQITGDMTINSLQVIVDIEHTYRGDLVVELVRDDVTVTLWDREGGSADNISETVTLDDFNGTAASGVYTLRVRDTYNADTGTIRRFAIQVNE